MLTDRDGNSGTNQSYVDYNVYCQSSGSGSISANHTLYFSLGGNVYRNENVYVNVSSPNAYISIASGTMTATHNTDGTLSLNFSASISATGGYGVSASTSGTFTLETIPRYANLTSLSVQSRTINSVTLKYTTDKSASLFCSIDGGGSWLNSGNPFKENTTSGTFTIYYSDKGSTTRLTPNKSYTFTVLCRASDSGLDTSKNISTTTYDIARITSAPDINIGNSHTVTWSNPSGTSTSLKLCKTDGTSLIDYGTVTGTSKTVTPTANTIYALTPNSNTITLRYIITTTANSSSYTAYKDCVFTVTNSNPIFSYFEYEDVNSTTTVLTGNNQILVKGYSNVKGIISTSNKATAQNSATMKSYKLLVGDKSSTVNYSDSEEVSTIVNAVNTNTIDMYATDSRGNSTKVSKTATIKNYSNIKIISVTATRENNVGQTVILKFEAEFWNDSFGSVANTISNCTYKYKETSSSDYITGETELTYTINENKISGNISIKGDLGASGFDVSNSYNIQLIVSDKLSSASDEIIIGSGEPAIAIYKNNVAIGQKYDTSTGEKLQVKGNAKINGDVDVNGNLTVDGINGNIKMNNGQVYGTKGGSWIASRDNATVRNNSYGQTSGNSYNPVVVQKTTLGAWAIGNLSGEESLRLVYTTDNNYSSGTNKATYNLAIPANTGLLQLAPTILYNNSSGSNGTITLSETAANFSYIEIFYGRGNGTKNHDSYSTKIVNPNGKKAGLMGSFIAPYTSTEYLLQIRSRTVLISGTSIITSSSYGGYDGYLNMIPSGIQAGPSQETEGYIFRVIGYR